MSLACSRSVEGGRRMNSFRFSGLQYLPPVVSRNPIILACHEIYSLSLLLLNIS